MRDIADNQGTIIPQVRDSRTVSRLVWEGMIELAPPINVWGRYNITQRGKDYVRFGCQRS
jgi:hypothetical protein